MLANALFLALSPLLNEGSIQGRVNDPSGAVVAGAQIKIENLLTGFTRTATSGAAGEFRILGVPNNNYHLTVTRDGFALYEDDVAVRGAVPVNLEVKLALAGDRTTVRVEAFGADVLENVPYAHYDVDRVQFSKLPGTAPASGLSDAITFSAPGIVADSNGFFHPLGDHAQAGFLIDGQPVTDQQSKQFSTQYPLNALQSMELITGGASAEYGDKTSLVIDAQTRSGLATDRPFGSFLARYGSFGTVAEESAFGFGGKRFGNFLVANGERSGRFLDTPEFRPNHAIGNAMTIFDRIDAQLDDSTSFRLGIFGARNWFQVPNDRDQLRQDQRQRVTTFSVAPGLTGVWSPRTVWNLNTFFRQDRVDYYPSRDPEDDEPATVALDRHLTNAGFRGAISYVNGRNSLKVGGQAMQTRIRENFFLRAHDEDEDKSVAAARRWMPHRFARPLGGPGGEDEEIEDVDFSGRGNVKQYAFFIHDSLSLGNLTLNGGLRVDRYDGFSQGTMAQPRAGASYLVKKTGTIFRYAYSRTMETPYNEMLAFSTFEEGPTPLGRRNQHNAGVQQALGRWAQIDADYFWKNTENAYDFETLFNTPIVFPAALYRSKIDGFAVRIASRTWRGFQAYTLLGGSRARYFEDGEAFRIDHDQRFQQTTFARYQYKNGPWLSFTWRFDSGMVAGDVDDVPEDVAPLLRIPNEITPDHSPARVAPRHLFNVAAGTDNLFRADRYRTSLRFSVVNLTNKVALYNYRSVFAGTHYVTPRAYTVELGFNF
ncbi:MAG: TonB-dependent receptor [Bryobacteraceae bacterium]|nr:TonB-dependent receptor [Bryobacteraceae bacterium]